MLAEFAIADVSLPLLSVSALIDKGLTVVFLPQGSGIYKHEVEVKAKG